jgi:phosphatidylglycerol:prolipoprotein diacylglycerol transferase
MIPFLHLGPLTIPTFGLMVATGLLLAAYVLQADFDRRRASFEPLKNSKNADIERKDEGFLIIGIAGFAGLIGARLYHLLETPSEFFADPWPLLFSRFGFAWFGGFLGGLLALIVLARYLKIPLLKFLDICSPAACVGYAIGRIGCLLSGDGDYGRPTSLPWGMSFPSGIVPTSDRVHPTPLYEFFIWMAIAAILWQMGKRSLAKPRPAGEVFCGYLLLTGIARFLIEIIRINPRSFFGLSNAQTASVVSVLIGAFLLWRIESRFPATNGEPRVATVAANPGSKDRPASSTSPTNI